MVCIITLSALLAITFMTLFSGTGAVADPNSYLAALERRYSTPHSLGDNYQFDPRDGWQTVNVSNLAYKYARSIPEESNELDSESEEHEDYSVSIGHHKRSSRAVSKKHISKLSGRSSKRLNRKSSSKKLSLKSIKSAKPTTKSILTSGLTSKAGGLTGSIKSIIDSMTGTGSSEPVTITWCE